MKLYDTIIVGAGPSGMTAGIYLARSKKSVLIIDKGIAGGQMVLTHQVANYPGFENISGYSLSMNMMNQAKSFGCDIVTNQVISSFDLKSSVKKIVLSSGEEYGAQSVIIATGGRSRTLNINGEEEFTGRGISYCATCDGDFFTGKEIIVVGGGNSALEEAESLTKYATKVTVVHQFDEFQAFKSAVNEAKENPKIHFLMQSKIEKFYGNQKLESVDIRNLKTNELYNLPIEGVFVFIGYMPNSEFFKHEIHTNTNGEILVNNRMMTSLDGVFAAGDVTLKRFRQITTAVSDGTLAALNVLDFLNTK